MSKKRDDCAVCGTYGNSQAEVKPTHHERGQVLMKRNSTSRIRTKNTRTTTRNGNNIIHFDQHRRRQTPPTKYAELHRSFLQTYHPNFYTKLSATGKLDEWLRTIDEIATHRFELGKNIGYTHAEIENALFTEVIYNLK